MITDFNNITSTLVKLALDMHSVQHNLLATNIANANTNNFHRSSINFDQVYEDMNVLLEQSDFSLQSKQIKASINAGSYTDVSNNNGVELDNELIGLSVNTVKYKALLSALSSRGEIMKLAITGEKR